MTNTVPTLVRAQLFHTPWNPFAEAGALEAHSDGALVFAGGRVLAAGDFAEVRRHYPAAEVHDHRDALLLPGLVDSHVHYPQLSVIGAMGLRLLEWLETRTLPEEARLADADYAKDVARTFLQQLLRNGTTSALVFGAHFPAAQEALFVEAETVGLRVTSGLVLSDCNLLPELHVTPEQALAESRALIGRWHGRGRLRYAVTPRFSLSCSERMLAVCGELVKETADLFFTTHLNENVDEIRTVAAQFPWAEDYLATYERFGLVGARSLFAHNVHPTERELSRLAAARSSVCHCPSSNAFIGSGLFPMRRHLHHGVQLALGSDVGGGTGFSLLKEGLAAYQGQMLLQTEGEPLGPAHLLYLATKAGANALHLNSVGDFQIGKEADFVLLRPPAGSTLAEVLRHSPSAESSLGAVFTLAREESVAAVAVAGEVLHGSL